MFSKKIMLSEVCNIIQAPFAETGLYFTGNLFGVLKTNRENFNEL